MKFLVANDDGDNPTWWLYGAGGELVAWAGENFSSIFSATRAAQVFKAVAHDARFEVYQDSGDHWRWRAWRSSHRVAASGESFPESDEAHRAAGAVKLEVANATGL